MKGFSSFYIRGHQPKDSVRLSQDRLLNENKICTSCKLEKKKSEFRKKSGAYGDGRSSYCFPCEKVKLKNYFKTEAGKQSRKRAAVKLRKSGYYKNLECRVDQRFRRAKQRAKSIGRLFDISFEEYKEIISKPCHYCRLPMDQKSGYCLERLDNSVGYTKINVVPCCTLCNCTRSNRFTVGEMISFLGPTIHIIRTSRTCNNLDPQHYLGLIEKFKSLFSEFNQQLKDSFSCDTTHSDTAPVSKEQKKVEPQ